MIGAIFMKFGRAPAMMSRDLGGMRFSVGRDGLGERGALLVKIRIL
jgi:hypothetical protein